jgi:hypothetical protein
LSAAQETEIQPTISDGQSPSEGDLTQTPTTDTPQTEPVKREKWEKQMLKLAIACLKANPANTGEEMQTATFGDGKYRALVMGILEMWKSTAPPTLLMGLVTNRETRLKHTAY